MKMKYLPILILALIIAESGVRAEEFPGSDPRVTWIGRTQVQGSEVSFDWSGVYAIIRFSGNRLQLRASDSGKDYFSVWHDRDDMTPWPDRTVCLSGRDRTVTLFDNPGGDPSAVHQVILQKRTEGSEGKVCVHGFIADGLLQARTARDRVIEFVGDSFTCGYGTLSYQATDPFTPETEDCGKTYAAILARHFGADYWIIAHSGMGVARNYGDASPGWYMPDRYLQTFDGQRQPGWSARDYGVWPALTVIYLATNDVSSRKQPAREAFVRNYLTLIRHAKDNYGSEHPVLCMVPQGRDLMYDYIKAALQQNDMKNVHYMVLTGKVYDRAKELGASSHPNYDGQLKIAYALLPYLSTVTGWPIGEIPLQ